jgi:hypothetical protein
VIAGYATIPGSSGVVGPMDRQSGDATHIALPSLARIRSAIAAVYVTQPPVDHGILIVGQRLRPVVLQDHG